MVIRILLIAFIALSAFAGCAGEPPVEPDKSNIPFIVSDSVRARYSAKLFIMLESNGAAERKTAQINLAKVALPEHLAKLLKDVDSADIDTALSARKSLAKEGKTILALVKFDSEMVSDWNDARSELCVLGEESLIQMVEVLANKILLSDDKYKEWSRAQISACGKAIVHPVYVVLKIAKNNVVVSQLSLALAELGKDAEPVIDLAITPALLDSRSGGEDNIGVSLALINALGESGNEYWTRKLTNLLANDSRWQVRAEAASALGKIVDFSAAPFLVKGLSDTDITVRENCVKALGGIKEPGAVPELIRLLDTKDNPNFISSVVIALTQITGKRFGGKLDLWKKWWAESSNSYNK
jgi:hypothetical protein